MRKFLRILRWHAPEDLEPGDFAKLRGQRGVGLVESVRDGIAVIAWSKDRRDIVPVAMLMRVPARGAKFDSRGTGT